MGAHIKYSMVDGNTIPYPPLFDHVRRNYGFIDTRGRPDRVVHIPETKESYNLAALLQSLASPKSQLVSLGCDLGQHENGISRPETRRVAGGYVQVASAQKLTQERDLEFLQSVGKFIEQVIKKNVRSDRWNVNLQLSPVLFKNEEEFESKSIWIWFYAKASTFDRAKLSRERLLGVLSLASSNFMMD